jgi:hypothetical protein
MIYKFAFADYSVSSSVTRLANACSNLANQWNGYIEEKATREAQVHKTYMNTLNTVNGLLIVSSCALFIHSVSTLWFLNLKRQEHNQRRL